MHKLSTITETDIWAHLDAALGPQVASERPPDSVTAEEFAARRKVSHSQACTILRRLVQDGVLKRVPFRGTSGKTVNAYLAASQNVL